MKYTYGRFKCLVKVSKLNKLNVEAEIRLFELCKPVKFYLKVLVLLLIFTP